MKNKKIILLLAALTIMMTMTGCSSVSDVSSSLYNNLVGDDNDTSVPQNITVEGKFVYDSIVQYAKSQIPYETYFSDYSKTNFPDYVTLEPCNEKISQGVYANYYADYLTNIEFSYITNFGNETQGTLISPGIYCNSDGKEVEILYFDLINLSLYSN